SSIFRQCPFAVCRTITPPAASSAGRIGCDGSHESPRSITMWPELTSIGKFSAGVIRKRSFSRRGRPGLRSLQAASNFEEKRKKGARSGALLNDLARDNGGDHAE